MPSISSPAAERRLRRGRIDRLDRLAEALDAKFRVFGFPVGWDSILGIVPGIGDLVTAGPGAIMIYEANRIGARKRVMARMAANTGIDMVIGGIPLLGDAFDLVFKSHRKNMDLLKRELARIEDAELSDAGREAARERGMDRVGSPRRAERNVSPTGRDGMAAQAAAASPAKAK